MFGGQRMSVIAGYITFLVVFGAMDAVWLSIMVPRIYLPTIGDMAASPMRILPAIIFYLLYAAGALFFTSARAEQTGAAFVYGVLFGAVAYATYDLTNYATLRNWNLSLTLIDMFWGATATGVAATAAYMVMRYVAER